MPPRIMPSISDATICTATLNNMKNQNADRRDRPLNVAKLVNPLRTAVMKSMFQTLSHFETENITGLLPHRRKCVSLYCARHSITRMS